MHNGICYEKTPPIDDFVRGYIEAALWTTRYYEADGTDGDEMYLYEKFDLQDISKEALFKIIKDCEAFRTKMQEHLELVMSDGTYELGQAGHDFWMSRDGQGCGFFDHTSAHSNGLMNHVWEKLQTEASNFKRVTMEVDDDGRIQQIS